MNVEDIASQSNVIFGTHTAWLEKKQFLWFMFPACLLCGYILLWFFFFIFYGFIRNHYFTMYQTKPRYIF